MNDIDRPILSLGDLTEITDEHYLADHAVWDALRPLLKPTGWNDTTHFSGPRPPKQASKFYLILSNYSTEFFFIEARKYPRYPPNPNSRNWLVNLAKRVEDHVIGVVKDIEESNPETDFSYHGVDVGEMRKTIQQRLEKEMKHQFPTEFPHQIPPPTRPQRLTPETLRKIGIDPENTSPLLEGVMAGINAGTPLAPQKAEQSFGEELDRLLLLARITPERIAQMIKVDPTTVYRHKSGKFSPTRTRVGKYEKALSGILGYEVKLPTPVKRQKPIKRQQNASKTPESI